MELHLNNDNTAQYEPPMLIERDVFEWYRDGMKGYHDRLMDCLNQRGISPTSQRTEE